MNPLEKKLHPLFGRWSFSSLPGVETRSAPVIYRHSVQTVKSSNGTPVFLLMNFN